MKILSFLFSIACLLSSCSCNTEKNKSIVFDLNGLYDSKSNSEWNFSLLFNRDKVVFWNRDTKYNYIVDEYGNLSIYRESDTILKGEIISSEDSNFSLLVTSLNKNLVFGTKISDKYFKVHEGKVYNFSKVINQNKKKIRELFYSKAGKSSKHIYINVENKPYLYEIFHRKGDKYFVRMKNDSVHVLVDSLSNIFNYMNLENIDNHLDSNITCQNSFKLKVNFSDNTSIENENYGFIEENAELYYIYGLLDNVKFKSKAKQFFVELDDENVFSDIMLELEMK